MIRFNDADIFTLDRQSSKGNQLKFRQGEYWYKADNLGYEGLSEYVISNLLRYSNLNTDEFVSYELEQMEYNGTVYNGCRSRDFADGWNLITLERLFKDSFGYGFNRMVYSIEDHEQRLKTLVEQVERITGLRGFGIYMSKILAVDALFLNEDRHANNIAFMTKDRREFRLAPIFDNGAGLLSDTRIEYPLSKDVFELIGRVKPKTFSDSFYEQLTIAEHLYGNNISFDFGYEEVQSVLRTAGIYQNEIIQRVTDIIMEMRRRYSYLFR